MARRLAAGAMSSAPRVDKQHTFTLVLQREPCVWAIEMADWRQHISNCREGTGHCRGGQPSLLIPPPPVTASNRSLTLSLLCLNQGLMLNFGYDPRSNGIGVSFPLQYGIGFQPV